MTEGTFPKVDGDILYASEVNRFASAGRGFYIGSGVIGSATAYQNLGSVVIGPGSLSNPCLLVVDVMMATNAIKVQISGLAANNYVEISGATSTSIFMSARATLGSPYPGRILGIASPDATQINAKSNSALLGATSTINHLDTGSTVVVFVKAASDSAGAVGNYSVQSFRGGV